MHALGDNESTQLALDCATCGHVAHIAGACALCGCASQGAHETHTAPSSTVSDASADVVHARLSDADVARIVANRPKPSKYATTTYNRYARLLMQIRDLYSTVEHFRLPFAAYLERKRERVTGTDDWRRLPRIERARLDGYMDARYEALANRMVWILHYPAHTGSVCEGTVTVEYAAGYAFDRGPDYHAPKDARGNSAGYGGITVNGSVTYSGTGHVIPWNLIDGGCHYWPPKPEDVQKYRLGLMKDTEVWRPWSNPEEWSTK